MTGKKPFPWQERLYSDWLAQGKVPRICNLPTGLGKTSMIAIWLIAFARCPDKLPRRLVYVVNRRTVVDQTTNEVVGYRTRIGQLDATHPFKEWGGSFAISTLRGEFADNREWSADPSRPAVIVGTVDMIGSRLLFGGYGVGFKLKPLHAGFLGQDALIVHDEAHLEPAFQVLLESIRDEQQRDHAFGRFEVMQLTATSRNDKPDLELTNAEKTPGAIGGPPQPIHLVWQRQTAKKKLSLVPSEKISDEIIRRAKTFDATGSAILIFFRLVEDVEKVVGKLPRERTLSLTGTMRGKERDELVKNPIFQRFLPKSDRDGDAPLAEGTVYLVCTSAGEVGINWSADHMVGDLSTFESMTQRFGRVNRFGERIDTQIHVVHPTSFGKIDQKTGALKADEVEKRQQKTLELLRKLPSLGGNEFDASPKALSELPADERAAAFLPLPVILPLTDILLDAWSLTTIRERLPGRPPIEPYLHGVSEWEPPETCVAWREEVGVIKGPLLDAYDPAELLEDYPLKPHEWLRDRSDRVFGRLKRLRADMPLWIISSGDDVLVTTVEELGEGAINDKIVLLPPAAGGLQDGLLNPISSTADDVADEWADGRRRRIWNQTLPGWRLIREIVILDETDEDGAPRFWRWYELPDKAEAEPSKSAKKPVRLDVHTRDVAKHAREIVERLSLPKDLQEIVVIAAKLHDAGKNRPVFQRVLRNPNPDVPWAKSNKPLSSRNSYRHEFGSLLDAESDSEFQRLDPSLQDLARHLIAAHHGRARPHFPTEEAYDPQPKGRDVLRVVTEVPRRFAKLQRQYGRWGLAYLESLLRAADHAASANPSETVEDSR